MRYFQIDPAGTAGDVTVVEGDVDGNDLADFQIGVSGLINLAAADFIL